MLALNHDLAEGNAATASWLNEDPRVYGNIVVNPLHISQSMDQIATYSEHPGFVGLKTIQELFNMGLDDPAYEPLLAEAAKRDLPVMAHLMGMDVAAQRHPEVTFVATHANWGRAQRFIDLPNVCFDFSTSHANRHETQLGRFIDAVGASRVMFGSDGQVISPAWSLGKLVEVELDSDSEELILRGNAYRVFPRLLESKGG
jgi:predicted TIM-barrel fold metal-dependent hydrolase